ncbi:FAD-dependent oxidoreductase [Mycobacterium yunnanensis]|uniref:ferredoxin--NADP(+) reductase n=1 Tax=Mycobacterium yunnanensis TaxID=368477 RepID=A0A9X2Z800_9MYCO|nr:FAD-dependent oxidoreductase [Mycobacterium yunnanensis]MCV7423795.1 FAD-dependent oxidoreductase [Mycobacterium yunnanensis]
MAYVITQNCCKDASCVPVCPVDCIRPVGGAGESTDTEMLYIDPEACIDCGACMDECPVGAVHYEDDLSPSMARFKDINATYFARHPLEPYSSAPAPKHRPVTPGRLRVAIVGAGPAACYAATELIGVDGVEVNLFERLPTPYGLVRAGVAPDHQHTKSITDVFRRAFASPRLTTHLNVDVGRDLSHADMLDHHHAVIYAVGAADSRSLGIPGEELPGSHAASDFVAWYNGHPDHTEHDFDLTHERAVIIGNGNVALDVARILLATPEQLAVTDIAHHALEALRHSAIEEVVVVGRRRLRNAAFSVGEFLALGSLDGVSVAIEGDDDLEATPHDDVETTLKLDIAREYVDRKDQGQDRRIILRFLTSPVEFVGEQHLEGLSVVRNRIGDGGGLVLGDSTTDCEILETGLVLRSIGYRGSKIDGVPWDWATGRIPNVAGRVIDDDHEPIPGVYVTGWAKRGSRGVIGTNRACAEETVTALLQDFDTGRLVGEIGSAGDLSATMGARGVDPVSWSGWHAIDARERELGAAELRPRRKLVDVEALLAAAADAMGPSGGAVSSELRGD